MHPRFVPYLEQLESKFQTLMSMSAVKFAQLPANMPERGIYLFSETDLHLYVGRTNRIRSRLQNHCRPSGSHFLATFAFRVARQETGLLKASYSPIGSRAKLAADPIFGAAFARAKARVAAMDIRFVAEPDPVSQTLLEVYIAIILATPFNDFENH